MKNLELGGDRTVLHSYFFIRTSNFELHLGLERESSPGVNIDVGPGAKLRRPAIDFTLQPVRLQKRANFLGHIGQWRDGKPSLPPLLRPIAPVVGFDLVGRDE